jgi:hypothetical protein
MASPFLWPVLVPYALRAPAPVNLGVGHMNPKFAHLYDKDIPNDITVGIVLHLDPDVLEKEGSTFTCVADFRV